MNSDIISLMIRPCRHPDVPFIFSIINNSALAFKGLIPADRWKDPYMPDTELMAEIDSGVKFHCFEENGRMLGVMGVQDRGEATLIRHAYVLGEAQRRGIGSALLRHLLGLTKRPVLVGTWEISHWAINFYRKHGFDLVSTEEKDMLLKKYWSLPERQAENSVVLRLE